MTQKKHQDPFIKYANQLMISLLVKLLNLIKTLNYVLATEISFICTYRLLYILIHPFNTEMIHCNKTVRMILPPIIPNFFKLGSKCSTCAFKSHKRIITHINKRINVLTTAFVQGWQCIWLGRVWIGLTTVSNIKPNP